MHNGNWIRHSWSWTQIINWVFFLFQVLFLLIQATSPSTPAPIFQNLFCFLPRFLLFHCDWEIIKANRVAPWNSCIYLSFFIKIHMGYEWDGRNRRFRWQTCSGKAQQAILKHNGWTNLMPTCKNASLFLPFSLPVFLFHQQNHPHRFWGIAIF